MLKFLQTLFDEGQTTCFTESPYGYKVRNAPLDGDLFFSINALHPFKDLQPTKDWHDPNQPRRADCNVVCYRNFLIELDRMPLEKQVEYVTSEIPVTSIVYSGGKSHHFIISLQEPVATASEYARIAKRLTLLFPDADPACKNPSRLSRLPDRLRPDTEKRQTLVHLGHRAPLKDLLTLLPEAPEYVAKSRTLDEVRSYVTPLILTAVIEPDRFMAEHGIHGRNALTYWLGRRFEEVNMEMDKRRRYLEMLYSNLEDTSNFSFEEAMSAARVRPQ